MVPQQPCEQHVHELLHIPWLRQACIQDRQAAAECSAQGSSASHQQPSSAHAEALKQFREHADNTNDIFRVAAQAVAHTLLRARAALPAGAICISAHNSACTFWGVSALCKGRQCWQAVTAHFMSSVTQKARIARHVAWLGLPQDTVSLSICLQMQLYIYKSRSPTAAAAFHHVLCKR